MAGNRNWDRVNKCNITPERTFIGRKSVYNGNASCDVILNLSARQALQQRGILLTPKSDFKHGLQEWRTAAFVVLNFIFLNLQLEVSYPILPIFWLAQLVLVFTCKTTSATCTFAQLVIRQQNVSVQFICTLCFLMHSRARIPNV